MKDKVFIKAFKISAPILLAHFPLGVVFGLMFENQNYLWYLAPIMSLVTYAGAVQFLALSFIEQGAGLFQLALASFCIAVRNVFYGPAFFERFSKFSCWSRLYLKFALIDGTYALLLNPSPVKESNDEKYCLYLSFLNHFYWVFGTFLGALLGKSIPQIKGMEFVLTLLFSIMAVDQYMKNRKIFPIIVGVLCWSIVYLISYKYILIGSIFLALLVFLIIEAKNNAK